MESWKKQGTFSPINQMFLGLFGTALTSVELTIPFPKLEWRRLDSKRRRIFAYFWEDSFLGERRMFGQWINKHDSFGYVWVSLRRNYRPRVLRTFLANAQKGPSWAYIHSSRPGLFCGSIMARCLGQWQIFFSIFGRWFVPHSRTTTSTPLK